MKKINLIYGLVYIILAAISLYFAVSLDPHKITGLFYGLTGALAGGGIIIIIRYFYWQKIKKNIKRK